MKNILTLLLVLCSLLSYAQPTLATLDARLKTVETLTKVIEGSTMTLPQFNLAMDSIAFKRDSALRNNIQGWMNDVRRIMEDSFNVRLVRARREIRDEDAKLFNTILLRITPLEDSDKWLLTEIEALKLRITNLKVTIQ